MTGGYILYSASLVLVLVLYLYMPKLFRAVHIVLRDILYLFIIICAGLVAIACWLLGLPAKAHHNAFCTPCKDLKKAKSP